MSAPATGSKVGLVHHVGPPEWVSRVKLAGSAVLLLLPFVMFMFRYTCFQYCNFLYCDFCLFLFIKTDISPALGCCQTFIGMSLFIRDWQSALVVILVEERKVTQLSLPILPLLKTSACPKSSSSHKGTGGAKPWQFPCTLIMVGEEFRERERKEVRRMWCT